MTTRFWSKVDRYCGCWIWRGARNKKGYGLFRVGNSMRLAHRVAWMLTFGETNQHVLHECDHPWCVNPLHLWLGTIKDNNLDCIHKGRSGLRPGGRGEANGRSMLSAADVINIRKRADENRRALGDEFGVTRQTIHEIIHRRRWSHVA